MDIYDFNEIIYLKNSDVFLQKLEKIKNTLHEMGITFENPSWIQVNDNKISFTSRFLFPFN